MSRRAIEACQRCGSDALHLPSVGDGVLVGQGQDLSLRACQRCGLVAVPFEFDDVAARKAFEAERLRHPSKDWPRVGWPQVGHKP